MMMCSMRCTNNDDDAGYEVANEMSHMLRVVISKRLKLDSETGVCPHVSLAWIHGVVRPRLKGMWMRKGLRREVYDLEKITNKKPLSPKGNIISCVHIARNALTRHVQ